MNKWIYLLNWLLIIIVAANLFWLSAFFFIGHEEAHSELVEELPWSFFGRFWGFCILSLILAGTFFALNFLFSCLSKEIDKQYRFRISLIATVAWSLASLIGVCIFFLF